ncbi:FAD-dependent oxidoreductase [Rhizobium laguerreae]|uniref:FAD-dependent oxidoreductase n=1 Tax=Rhizobium laguerreae TaxID=1076926 RepID=UPI001C91618F|nr:FAD-dependent oxidoreductase [Rhizobium laguerreae]MBY3246150.1 FAD-dependent oxidoreductase [Rhizobium laguerreae]MBY3252771.1 FAD-dependent oxidoreductase [Rhizobium laguerreae]
MFERTTVPVAIIGAGPVGLAAAAHLRERNIASVTLEAGEHSGASLLEWGHVRVFSPWRYVIDEASARLLERHGWSRPDPDGLPTGREIVDQYLSPLSNVPDLADSIVYGADVVAISRSGLDKVTDRGRDAAAFEIRYVERGGAERTIVAGSVLDASGTWRQPSPLGVTGLPVLGEKAAAGAIAYGIPDVLGRDRDRYDGKRVLVVGGGHSAINVVLSLLELRIASPTTSIIWGLRRKSIDRLLGGGLNDQLPARGDLGAAARAAIESKKLRLVAPFSIDEIHSVNDALGVNARVDGAPEVLEVDSIVVATGFRPDLNMLRELRLDLDPAVEAPKALAPMIDPNLHSCGTVPPHGVVELSHPEKWFYVVGSKSYGRAPTFLMATGYEQVRSIAAELAGDHAAARQVHLVLPETGVCSTSLPVNLGPSSSGCCGGPAPAEIDACCVADEVAKEAGKAGCGCGTPQKALARTEPAE